MTALDYWSRTGIRRRPRATSGQVPALHAPPRRLVLAGQTRAREIGIQLGKIVRRYLAHRDDLAGPPACRYGPADDAAGLEPPGPAGTGYPLRVAEHETTAQVLAAERTAVLGRLARLELELSGIIESGSAGADDEHDPEGATLAFERQHAAALLSHARQHLADIEAAILRLAEGQYGSCAVCGQPIGAARLAARPAAATCVRCAATA